MGGGSNPLTPVWYATGFDDEWESLPARSTPELVLNGMAVSLKR